MSLFPPQAYRKTEFTHRIGLAADKPLASDVLIGTLYFSTNTLVLERSNGTIWESYCGTQIMTSTSTQSSASVTASSTTVLAANAARLGATIFAESGAVCLLKLGATASITSYSVAINIGGYYEIPFGYTGVIDGITISGTSVLRITEFTA